MEIKDQFKKIYLNNRREEIMPFLKGLSLKERKSLVPFLREFSQQTGAMNTSFASDIYMVTCFACCTKSQFKSIVWYFEKAPYELCEELFEWYKPEWFSDYWNEMVKDGLFYSTLDYEKVLDWKEKGFLNPSEELIVASLSRMLFRNERGDDKIWKKVDTSDLLFRDPVTLREHIWLFFNCDDYNIYGKDWDFENKKSEQELTWKRKLKDLSTDRYLDRMRILRESLKATNKGFKKDSTNWYIDLFIEMKPSTEELLSLQDELFSTLSSPQSKVVNATLGEMKKITDDDRFRVDELIISMPLLLTSSVKSIASASLTLYENIAKKCEDKRGQITEGIAMLFLNKDQALQTKAAKLILKYGNVQSQALQENIRSYADNLLAGTKELLNDFLSDLEPEDSIPEIEPEPQKRILENNRIPEMQNVEDFVFFASQAFGNNEPFHFDWLIGNLVKYHSEIDEAIIEKLDPAFQKAYDGIVKYSYSYGIFDNLLACFFLDYGISIHHGKSKILENARNHTLRIDKWKFNNSTLIFKAYHQLLVSVFDRLKQGISLPVLSTPTHTPTWIDPEKLIERIKKYQDAGITPVELDLQLALLRCAVDDMNEIKAFADKNLSSQYAGLLAPLFEENYYSKNMDYLPEEFKAGNFQWSAYLDRQKETDWKDGKRIEVTVLKPRIRVHEPLYYGMPKNPVFLDYFLNTHMRSAWEADIQRIVLTSPLTIDAVLAKSINDNMMSSSSADLYDRRKIINILEILARLDIPFRKMHHLFIATSMLAPEKTIRDYAAEIWINRVYSGYSEGKQIGEVLGEEEKIEWGPLKRFTDLVEKNMMNISQLHNRELQVMIEACLEKLNENPPIKDLKKLLEIYREILILNRSSIDKKTLLQLDSWKENNNLKKICKWFCDNISG